MKGWFSQHHTKILWGFAAFIAFLAATNITAVNNLRAEIEDQKGILAQPQVRTDLVAGVPAGLSEEFAAAVAGVEDPSSSDSLWLTVRTTNQGYEDVDRMEVAVDMVPEISGIYALSFDGDNFAEEFGGPEREKIEDSIGSKTSSANVQFDRLPVGSSHLVFVGVRPEGYGTAPYSAAERRRWTSQFRYDLDQAQVTAVGGLGDGSTRVQRIYGLAASAAEPQAGAAPPESGETSQAPG